MKRRKDSDGQRLIRYVLMLNVHVHVHVVGMLLVQCCLVRFITFLLSSSVEA